MPMLSGHPKPYLGPTETARSRDRPSTTTHQEGLSADPLDEIIAELEVDPLDALIAELNRVKGHETTLQDAVANNKPVVVHPRPEAVSAPRAPETPATPQSFIIEGGLASFEVAQDLLYLDFSQPEHAPQEFRRSYDPERITSLRSGISGSFGQLDPPSLALHEYLRRIQQQAQQVRTLIDGQRQLRPDRKVLAPGGSSADLHSDQIRAGEAPSLSTQAHTEPPAMPRTSEGAVSIEAKIGKSFDGQAPPRHGPGLSLEGLKEAAALPHVTILANPSIKEKGEEHQSVPMRDHTIVKPRFYGRAEPRGPAGVHQPTQIDIWAVLRLALFIAGFGFYLFTRSTTMDATGSIPLFLYQLATILAEGLHFMSGCLVGIWQVRSTQDSQQRLQLKSCSRTITQNDTEKVAAMEASSASTRRPFRLQVIIDGGDTPLSRLLRTVAAVRDMQVPENCSEQIHVIHDARQHNQQAQWLQLSMDGLTLHDVSALHGEPDYPAGGSREGYTNMVLRQIYPSGTEIAKNDVIAFFWAGQTGADGFLQQALHELERPVVRMVYSQAATSSPSCYPDIYNQGDSYWQAMIAPRAPAWQCTAVPGDCPFLVYASSLHNIGWLPAQPAGQAAAVAERLARESRRVVPHPSPVEGCRPSTVPETYQAALKTAQGRLQQLFFMHKPKAQWNSRLRPLLQHTLAWCTIVSAVSTLFFILIPFIRVIFGVFPFNPNRWFGMGFLAYYCCCYPLLYQACTLQKAVILWTWHISLRILWRQHLTALGRMLPGFSMCHPLRLWRRQPQQDTEEGAGVDHRDEVRRQQGRPCRGLSRPLCIDVPLARDIPWRAVYTCVISLFGACIGTWLLFQDFQTALGPRRQFTVLSLFAANLSLILSILWCLCNSLVSALPCYYAAMLWCLRDREDGQIVQRSHHGLALFSMIALHATVCCMFLAAVVCIGLGEGAFSLQGAAETQDYDYSDALAASMQFYSAQKSGTLGPNYLVTWRGNSGLDDYPVGGYYVGTNNLKLTFPIAAATFQMAWGIASLPGSGAGISQQVFTEIRWATDYLLACFGDSSLVTQVGDTEQELSLWDRPEDMHHTRPSFSLGPGAPGADVMAHSAAALAAASVIFGGQDAPYAGQLFDAAQSLYLLAAANEGLSSTSVSPNATLYNSTSYLDDLMLASAWLAEVSGRPAYASAAETYWNRIFSGSEAGWRNLVPDWDNQWWAGNVILAGLTGNQSYQAQVEAFFKGWTQGSSAVAYTPQGLAVAGSEGVLRNAANAALLALVHARHTSGFIAVRLACWARDQIRYILGAGGRSYVVGWGVDPPTHIPSPAASCPATVVPCAAPKGSSLQYASPDPNPHTITGALVSGPSSQDALSDVRSAPDTAISVEYNGGFSGALAMLAAKEWVLTCGSRPGLIDRAGGHLQHSVW